MTIEITRDAAWVYRIDPDDARVVQHRPNRSGARWTQYMVFSTAHKAQKALLRLDEPSSSDGQNVV